MEKDKNAEDRKDTRIKKIRMILDSATFALLLSIVLFSYEMISSTRETDEIVDNLVDIQNSLTTRYLGLFPEYISSINHLLDEAIEHQDKSSSRDSIIIFEDVLYYGILSDAEGFRTMIENLLVLADYGCHITIAYYNTDGMPFKLMIRDKLISSDHQALYRADMAEYRYRMREFRHAVEGLSDDLTKEEYGRSYTALVDRHFRDYISNTLECTHSGAIVKKINNYGYVDSLLCQKYYNLTRNMDFKAFSNKVNGYLELIPKKKDAIDAVSYKVNNLCAELDKVKEHYLRRQHAEITYADYFNMYVGMTEAISNLFKQQPNIELIPLDETLLMSCWMSVVDDKEQAIFAFPSKYSTDEIGFVSQDAAIARYIHTMFKGIQCTQEDRR